MEHAVKNAISKASETIHNMRWFQVIETRGYIENNEISYWQITLKVGFTVE
jgi:flavin-binding protein dodecin